LNDADAAAVLLGAPTGHASVRRLSLQGSHVGAASQEAVGALLGALVTANAPALTELDVALCYMGDAGLRPLLDALPHNTHLRTLWCSDNGTSEAFAADVLLLAVRANTSLRTLFAGDDGHNMDGVNEAHALVRGRGAA
jgi:hypothetical protein